jgi:hypothetical protein
VGSVLPQAAVLQKHGASQFAPAILSANPENHSHRINECEKRLQPSGHSPANNKTELHGTYSAFTQWNDDEKKL